MVINSMTQLFVYDNREREREANVNKEFVGGSAIIVASRTTMGHATLDALFRG